MKRLIGVIAFFAFALPAKSDSVEFTIITAKGWVRHAAGSDWRVLGMQTKPPSTAIVYQILNRADEGTPDSTNVSIQTIETRLKEEVVAEIRKKEKQLGLTAKAWSLKAGWKRLSGRGMQDRTEYIAMDAYKDIADVCVLVGIAWPRLRNNPPDYDKRMQNLFENSSRAARAH